LEMDQDKEVAHLNPGRFPLLLVFRWYWSFPWTSAVILTRCHFVSILLSFKIVFQIFFRFFAQNKKHKVFVLFVDSSPYSTQSNIV
jgi:hypothetical protein